MIETLVSMWFPILVLTVAGAVTFGLGWWAAVVAEDRDGFLLGDDE